MDIFCRVDKKGMICDQLGVFRVNCIDCLDRTNFVQSAIARLILETQLNTLCQTSAVDSNSVETAYIDRYV